MTSNDRIYEQARQARDPRFDGRFFIGVTTTGVYCRPVCPVKLPVRPTSRFFETAAAAPPRQAFPPALALSSGSGAGDAGLAGNVDDRVPRPSADPARRAG
ncbi:MAG: Ada metal-binding domain-containing protein [Gammaproteobacteria bacterium]|nr:Ada metal-binding domain-containing protein [Gammaproteobacteria bacterium]